MIPCMSKRNRNILLILTILTASYVVAEIEIMKKNSNNCSSVSSKKMFIFFSYQSISKLYNRDIFLTYFLNNLQHLVKDNQSFNYIANLLRREENKIISAHQGTSWESKKIQSTVKRKGGVGATKATIQRSVLLKFINSIVYWVCVLLIIA